MDVVSLVTVMITPAFELSQDPNFLNLVIRVPYTRTSEFDVYIQGEDFKFYAKPYFLRLTLPGRIAEDGREKASFDIDKGVFTLRVPKETPGQHFEGLEMLTSLLAPKGSRSAKPLVVDADSAGLLSEASAGTSAEEDDEEDFNWELEQEVYTETPAEKLKEYHKYGFGNLRSGVFTRLQEELNEVIDVKDPDHTNPELRRSNRLDAETTIFCTDHYMLCLYEDEEEIKKLLRFKPWWNELKQDSSTNSDILMFTEEEKEQMRKFSNHSYLLDKKARFHVWLGLVDIVLAYVYDVRTTEGEHNVESSWTIRKLSGTLCWLETYHSVHDVLVSFGRRSLCYPLFRHFSLISKAIKDVACIFQAAVTYTSFLREELHLESEPNVCLRLSSLREHCLFFYGCWNVSIGCQAILCMAQESSWTFLRKACVLKCLLAIHKIFRENDPAYILNDLYITDYCIWIQRVKSKHVFALAETLHSAKLDKNHLDLELEILEQAAELAIKEEVDGEDEDHSTDLVKEEVESEDDEDDSSCGGTSDDEQPEEQATSGNQAVSRRLIEESRERLEEELSIQEDEPHSSCCSSESTEGERLREGKHRRLCTAETEREDRAAGDSVEKCLQRNSIRIINSDQLDSDDEEDTKVEQGP
ncbi:hypothetical protein DNTS_009470 [Danionella cerebrum]|uniref:Protein SHQ1 homolog n=1 Tax=Danionella cerebrum TaxID=2873325 RepID=A0A553PWU5_9TELE|nr:hypothetical protein DNTS_009470 [Danionella translucida]